MSGLNFKCLLLGAAAAATATTAQAADLPVAPEPVDYVRICDAYGARFYYIPGTETCLRVGGRVRTQFVVNNVLNDGPWSDRDSDGYTWLTRGYLYLDARTATGFGTLRAYAALAQDVENAAEDFDFDNAYIQWGGLTAGYLSSNFDIFTGQAFMGVVSRNWSDTTTQQLAYTAAFGNGFSATIALEDRLERDGPQSGGSRMPDVVGALGYSGGWGSAQLSGALHQVYPDAAFNSTNVSGSEDSLGWAVGAGVKFNLPMVNSGSNIYFQGFYADGALSYIGAGDFEINSITVAARDYDQTGDKTSGYSLSAGAYIQATPTIGLALDGSYMDIDFKDFNQDTTRWAVDGSVQWEPVSGFVLGADVGYANTDIDNVGDLDELLFGVRMQRTF